MEESGDGPHTIRSMNDVVASRIDVAEDNVVDVGKKVSGKDSAGGAGPTLLEQADAKGADVVQSHEFPLQDRRKPSISSTLDAEAFSKSISSWFGEKGFTAMRSFFRASVLNSVQHEVVNHDQNCTDMDVVMAILITDYLLRTARYFTFSVYSNEVLRPLSGSSAEIRKLMHRIGQSQSETVDPVLIKEDVLFVLRTLDLNPHSLLGAEILHRYFDKSQDLMSILTVLLKDNMKYLSIPDRSVPDNDVVNAFCEGLNEEIGKFQFWFKDFYNQFNDVSVKLKNVVCVNSAGNLNGLKEENVLWEKIKTIDDNLRYQQDVLLRTRDRERRKLAVYAKELEVLHKEMNAKLDSIQSYERFLKQKEKQMDEVQHLDRNFISDERGRGDYFSANRSSDSECDKKYYCSNKIHQNAPKTRDASTQKLYERAAHGMKGSFNSCWRIMDENLELKSVLREQQLRIDALTKRVAALTVDQVFNRESHKRNNALRNVPFGTVVENTFSNRNKFSNLRRPRDTSSLLTAMRRAKLELGDLKAEREAIDTQYERLLNNKLSKK